MASGDGVVFTDEAARRISAAVKWAESVYRNRERDLRTLPRPLSQPMQVFARVTSNSPDGNGLYPATITIWDSSALTWSDLGTAKILPLNGETLTNGTRYAVKAAGTVGTDQVFITVGASSGSSTPYGVCSAFYQNNSNSQVLPLSNVNLSASGPSITLVNYCPTGQSNILGADGSGNLAVKVTGEYFFWINMTLSFATLATAPPGLLSVLMGNWNGNAIRKEFPLGNGPTATAGGNGVMYTTQGPFFSQALTAPQTLALSMGNGTGTTVTLGAVEIYAERVL